MNNPSSHNSIQPRKEVLLVSPAYHGACDLVELENQHLNPKTQIDFSVNSNPYGPSPRVRRCLEQVPLDRYPDRDALLLRRALSTRLSIPTSQIVVGNGTAELLSLVALAFVQPGDWVLVIGPTFGEYSRNTQLMGGKVVTYTAPLETGFSVAPIQVDRLVDATSPRLVFLCRPNNPTGTILPLEALDMWTRRYPATLFVVDEAYLAFASGCPSALSLATDNIVVLRSMTKDYALAGLRLGYAAGPQSVISAIANVRSPWNVNALALQAGLVVLEDQTHLQQSLEKLSRACMDFTTSLVGLGLALLPSAVHFFLIPVGDGTAFRRRLMSAGISVRDCTSFGLPAFVRIATRRPEENERLIAALRKMETDNAG